jgi:hypothetical protein
MAVIKVAAFAGEKPQITSRLLPETAAKTASNVRLNDGALTPTHQALDVGGDAASLATKTIYLHADTWLSWDTEVWASPGPVAQDRLYYTGDGAPKMRASGTVYPLALPRPSVALTATPSGSGTGDVQSRTYAYTYVTSFGEESAPSPVSAIINWQPGQTVSLSGFVLPASGRGVTLQRIYRSQTGSGGTYLYLIAERAVANTDYVDSVAVDGFQEALPSADWNEPPDDLQGLISMPNGMMAAFSGRRVYFCEPYRPHAWPEKYAMTVASDIVGLGAIGSSLVVMTKGNPHLMSGSSPDTMQAVKLEATYPCINSRGIVDLGFAIVYPSELGLVAVRGDGSIGIASEELFGRDEWLALSPQTAIAGRHMDRYVLFYDTVLEDDSRGSGALLININAAQFLVRSAETASAVHIPADGSALYFTRPDDVNIRRFDAPDGSPETYYWRSKEFWFTVPQNFGAVLVDLGNGISLQSGAAIETERDAIIAANEAIILGDTGGDLGGAALNVYPVNGDALLGFPIYDEVTVNIYADKVLFHTLTNINQVRRLPAGKKARVWEFDVSANIQVTQVIMAGTVDELRSTQ